MALPVNYSRIITPNRSLSPKGRLVWLALITTTALIIALGAAAVGAWPVLPFAGFDVAFVCLAFHVVSRSDRDHEKLRVEADQVRFDSQKKGVVVHLEGNRAWLRIEQVIQGDRCWLTLCYAGRRLAMGRMLSDEQRIAWAAELKDVVGVTTSRSARRHGHNARNHHQNFENK